MDKKLHLADFLKSHLFIITLFLTIKVILLRYLLFGELDIIRTIALELSYILVFTAFIELVFHKTKHFLFLLVSILFSTIFLAIILYHSFFGSIATYFAIFQLGQVGAINESVSALIRPIYILFFIDIIIFIILMIIRKYPLDNKPLNKKLVVLPIFIVALIVSGANFILHKDEAISNNVVAAQEKGILNYEILEMYTGPEGSIPVDVDVSVENVGELKEKINELKELENIPLEDRKYFGAAEGRHLITIQVESMQDFPVQLEVDGEEVTPYINKLLEESFYFPNTVQQTGPGNTSDAEFIFNTSLYPVPFNPTSQTYGDKQIPSLPRLLKGKGYTTMTFHAHEIEFWNRVELYPALGFEKYYDDHFFGNEDIIGMGPSDEVLFNKSMPLFKQHHLNDQPFYAHLVGLTSHHPFTIPAYKGVMDLPSKFDGTLTGDYLKSINYMDTVIGNFIEDLKEAGIYENSVIVIYGDHFGLQQSAISEKDVDLVSELLGHEYKTRDRLNIPFIVHAPGVTDGQIFDEQLSGQLDMMPTVANLLGIDLDDQVVFGQDLLNSDENLLGVRYYMPAGSFFNGDIIFLPEKGFEDGTAYDYETEEEIDNFEQYKEDYERVLMLEKLSDDYLKSLPKRE